MRCFTVNWNNTRGEAYIKYAEWFTAKSDDPGTQMVMLDAINDAIADLEKMYEEIWTHSYGEKN